MTRSSGVLMHVSTLPGQFSCGAFGEEAKQWIDIISDAGFSFWQVLPFCLPDNCNSPYKSYSAFSLNPYFIDLRSLYNKGLITNEELESSKQKTPYVCEFSRLWEERIALLGKAAMRFNEEEKITVFLKKHPHTEKFCEFMALKASNGNKEWQKWDNSTPNADVFKTWAFIQYEFFVQWLEIKAYANKKGVKIIGDMPIYVSTDSSDVWADKKLFDLDEKNYPACVAGVPPDYFAEDGQLWGNPLYNWNEMKKDGYKWWKERMSFTGELFDGVRIDHFRAFESYYSVKATEKTAKNGTWIKGPGMELINALKAAGKDKLIIAEDLGDITKEVRQLVDDSGFPGMRVLQFGFLSDASNPHLPHNYDKNSVAYTGTHDNNTLLGYVWELSAHDKKRLLDYFGYTDTDNWNNCYDTILRNMLLSHSSLAIFPVQDLLLYGSDTRLNKPGIAEGNWAIRFTSEQLSSINKKKFRSWNELYGRI
ncbi:MAG: 4-alpha-glucanotransferase [Oscillospiraceae bacterium]|nr:4-alpha-glucanotransferase [Oscillospiraceae bacterium]